MDAQYIVRRLEAKLAKARAWRERAPREFDSNINGTGIPHTCGGLAVGQSAREYERAIYAAQKALNDHTSFILKGTIPDDLLSDLEE